MQRLSIIITNYNYAGYVADAIESALAVSWDDVEVIVVDDGSTDGSLGIINGYVGRVKIHTGRNSGQLVAANRGFAASTGDFIIFLDSDDVLPTGVAKAIDQTYGPSTSKVQFQMQRMDHLGRRYGAAFPTYRPVPSPAQIRSWMTKTSAYPTPPGSGNAYARWFLDEVFPLDSSTGDFADSACLAAAPFFGEVMSCPDVIIGYRQHDRNDSDLLAGADRFSREISRARARWIFAQRLATSGSSRVDERPLFKSRELLQFRVASRRVTGSTSGLPGDGVGRQLVDAILAPLRPGPETLRHRLLVSSWCLATLLAPKPVAMRLLRMRFGARRPLRSTRPND